MNVSYQLLDTGYCLASEHLMVQGGKRKTIRCHATAVLIEHPEKGFVLFDTGYAPRVMQCMCRFPFSIYRRATPIVHRENQSVKHQLHRLGLQTRDIGHIVISHFHADHIGGLIDFPKANLIASKEGFWDVMDRRGLRALQKAFIPELLPKNAKTRIQTIEQFNGVPLGPLGPTHDLFGDGSLRLCRLPGHAKGQLGLWAQTPQGETLFVADGCYLSQSFRENRPPSRLTSAFCDNFGSVVQTVRKLHDLHSQYPQLDMVPCHCPETTERLCLSS